MEELIEETNSIKEFLNDNQNALSQQTIFNASLSRLNRFLFQEKKLSSLPINTLTFLPSLTSLSLAGHKIVSLPDGIDKCLPNLTELDLSCNKLTLFPIQITKMANLINIHLQNNKITEIPIEILKLKNVQRLDLTGNGMLIINNIDEEVSVPEEFWQSDLANVTHGVYKRIDLKKMQDRDDKWLFNIGFTICLLTMFYVWRDMGYKTNPLY